MINSYKEFCNQQWQTANKERLAWDEEPISFEDYMAENEDFVKQLYVSLNIKDAISKDPYVYE